MRPRPCATSRMTCGNRKRRWSTISPASLSTSTTSRALHASSWPCSNKHAFNRPSTARTRGALLSGSALMHGPCRAQSSCRPWWRGRAGAHPSWVKAVLVLIADAGADVMGGGRGQDRTGQDRRGEERRGEGGGGGKGGGGGGAVRESRKIFWESGAFFGRAPPEKSEQKCCAQGVGIECVEMEGRRRWRPEHNGKQLHR